MCIRDSHPAACSRQSLGSSLSLAGDTPPGTIMFTLFTLARCCAQGVSKDLSLRPSFADAISADANVDDAAAADAGNVWCGVTPAAAVALPQLQNGVIDRARRIVARCGRDECKTANVRRRRGPFVRSRDGLIASHSIAIRHSATKQSWLSRRSSKPTTKTRSEALRCPVSYSAGF